MKTSVFSLLKLWLVVVLFVLPLGHVAQGQHQKRKLYRVVVHTAENGILVKHKGRLVKADSLGITISMGDDYWNEGLFISRERILQIKYWRKGGYLKAAGIGFLAGASVGGGGVLFAGKDDKGGFLSPSRTKEEKALGAAFGTGVAGGLIGVLAVPSSIVIDGDESRYFAQLPFIEMLVWPR